MKDKLVGVGIVLALVMVLTLFTSCSKSEDNGGASSDFRAVRGLISDDKLDEAREKIDEAAVEDPDSDAPGKAYFELAGAYEKKQDTVKARDIYRIILRKYQNVDNISKVQGNLSRLNIEILFSPIVTDEDVLYEVEPGDTLSGIAKRFKTTVDLIKEANSLESDTIRANSRLKVSAEKYKILVDKSQNLLTLLSGDDIFKVYRVSTGENNSTPVGQFRIINRIKDPVWYNQGAIVPSESPDNILGSRWLGISEPGYGIHGTVEPESVGQQATKGCVRMFNSDVEELCKIVPVGTEVTIAD
ncbi:MAG: L,D-transpeptidase family protein [Candidatus Omnitrophica bacterium]|nr:L,D-transpeptidase family protein [Candidatus Omnitrophota bacterium]